MSKFRKHYFDCWFWWCICTVFGFLFWVFPGMHLAGIGVVWLCLTCYLIALTIIGFIRAIFIR